MDIEKWAPRDGSQKKCMNMVLLKGKEEIKLIERGNATGLRGYLIVTTKRLLFAKEKGFWTYTYIIDREWNYEDIGNISIVDNRTISVVSVFNQKQDSWRFKNRRYPIEEVLQLINGLMRERLNVIGGEKQKVGISHVANNGVKEEKISNKGGVEQKCPNCGGDLSELNYYKLKAGNDVKCEFCNKLIPSGS